MRLWVKDLWELDEELNKGWEICMQKIKEYLLTTIGVALTAIALEYFFFPCDIAAGGVSGIGLVVNNGVTGLEY